MTASDRPNILPTMGLPIYTIDQLLHLRSSPLVSKPASLRPQEEWLSGLITGDSSIPSVNKARKKENTRQQPDYLSPTLEHRHLSHHKTPSFGARDENHLEPDFALQNRGTRPQVRRINSEHVTLGPPKTQFTSSKPRNRQTDDPDPDHTQGSLPDESIVQQPSIAYRARDLATASNENHEPYQRSKTIQPDYDSTKQEQEVRDVKFAANWRTGQQVKDSPVARKAKREAGNNRDWRSGNSHTDGGSGERTTDRNPEWMEGSLEPTVKDLHSEEAHTIEDFQRWKDNMNAERQKNNAPREVDDSEGAVRAGKTERKPSLLASPGHKLDPARWNFESHDQLSFWDEEPGDGASRSEESAASKIGDRKPRASRFAAMFSNQSAEPRQAGEQPTHPPAHQLPSSTSAEDQQGFQRILMMLGGSGLPTDMPSSSQLFQAPGPASLAATARSPAHRDNPLTRPLPDSGPLSAALQRPKPDTIEGSQETAKSKIPADPNIAFLLSLMVQPKKPAESLQEKPQEPPSPPTARGSSNRASVSQVDHSDEHTRADADQLRERWGSIEGSSDQAPTRRSGPPGLDRQLRSEFRSPFPEDSMNPHRPQSWQRERQYDLPSATGPLPTAAPPPGRSMNGISQQAATHGHPVFDFPFGFGGPSPPGMPPHPINQGPQAMNPPNSNLQQILQQGSQPPPHWSSAHPTNPSYRTMPSKPGPPPGISHSSIGNPGNMQQHTLQSSLPPPSQPSHLNQLSALQDPSIPFPYPPLPSQHQQQQQQPRHPIPLQHSDAPRPMPYRQEQQLRQQMTQPLPTHPGHAHALLQQQQQQQYHAHDPHHPAMHKGFLPQPWMLPPGNPGQGPPPLPHYLRQPPDH